MQTQNTATASIRWVGAFISALILLLTPLQAADGTLPVEIQCSPSAVVLHAVAAGDCLTVHADIRFSSVDRTEPVRLNGLVAYSLFADNRGDLVAKFNLTALRQLLTLPTTALTLTGVTTDGQSFAGTDVVRVME